MRSKRPTAGFLLMVILLLTSALVGCRLRPSSPTFPIDLKQIIPEEWAPIRIEEEDWDGDNDSEWLLLYRYNAPEEQGPVGGVIYDSQVDLQARHGGVRLPTRPAFLIPYPLLPNSQTGEGYLGLKSVEARRYDTDGDKKADEIVCLGKAYDGQVAFVSLFQWGGPQRGYVVARHFVGDGGIVVTGGSLPGGGETLYSGRIAEVVVRTQSHDRSLLCRNEVHRRGDGEAGFIPDEPPTLGFLYGVPEFPVYPEGTVLAYYLALAAGDAKKAKGYVITEEEAQPFKEHTYLRDFPYEIHTPASHPGVTEMAYRKETDISAETEGSGGGSFTYEWAAVDVTGADDNGSWERTWLLVNASMGEPRQSARWKLVGVLPRE
jgi:hypothetical protein